MSTNPSKQEPQASETTTLFTESPILAEIVKETERQRTEAQQKEITSAIAGLIRRSPAVQDSAYDGAVEDLINQRIAAIERTVSAQLDKVMHAENFQRLEATWRGLNELVVKTRLSKDLRIKVLDVDRRELERDLGVGTAKLKNYQDSALFNKIHDLEYNAPGGTPYGALIGGFEFSNDERDIALLSQIAKIAAVSHAPFIAAAAPALFGWEQFKDIQGGNALYKLVEGPEHANWNAFRQLPDSRYVGLVMPRYLSRKPYKRDEGSPEFTYEENRSEKEGPRFLWGNAAFVYGQVLTRAFADHGWCTAIRGPENGGDVRLPFFALKQHAVGVGPTDVIITLSQEKELSGIGLLALCQTKGTPEAVFYGAQSCQLPTSYYEHEVQESADLSARLPYIFAVSRFAHHLKAMLYRKIGSPMEREALEKFLHKWITNFVLDKPGPTADEMAKFPLARAAVEVQAVPGKVGEFHAIISLRPHIQLEKVDVAFRLVSNVPGGVVKK